MAGWLYASPYVMLRNFERAIDAKDADAIVQYVDFPALRASLREEYRAQITNQLADTLKSDSNPFAALGAGIGIALGDRLADSMIDVLVSPGSIRALIERAGGGRRDATGAEWPKFRTAYESFNRFVVHPGKEDGALILSRTGLGWKLAGVRLPHGNAFSRSAENPLGGMAGVDKARVGVASSQIDNFMTALGTYKLDTGTYPTTEQGLQALRVKPTDVNQWNGPYMPREIPKDPWGRAFTYEYPGTHGNEPEITCYGADGKPGGEGADADIVSWKHRD
jgi:general secretion pathway protein G